MQTTTIYKSDDKIHTNFTYRELFTKSADYKEETHELADIVLEALFFIREHYNVSIRVNSTLRTPLGNSLTPGSAKTSFHMKGMAIDFSILDEKAKQQYYEDIKDKNSEVFRKLRKIGITGFGLYDTFYHIDCGNYESRTGAIYQVDNYGKWKSWDKSTQKKNLFTKSMMRTV